MIEPIPTQTLQRLPLYLNYLKSLPSDEVLNISATMIAEELRLNDVQVRKDLAMAGQGGRPKIGYPVKDLISDIEHCLGYDNIERVVIVGLDNMGRALLKYEGFSEYGFDIVAAFDFDESVIGTHIFGKQVLSVEKLPKICSRMKIKMGIITVGSKEAQSVCDLLVKSGIMAIWNFSSVRLKVPDKIIVQNENLASSLAVLSNHLVEKFRSV
ncbi:redox-sensing transcriptional repressor Rex [Mobilitalea sibirica]|uniref:Redox-sensing transcriptional repressor Rex n=1 Tax=Mobilitalea sibirica TaxID=1462919 RepID=A0A8J7H0P4_9FIRM|nr:redox-sensing transcriptional repressor Rex [Mobilitalea sibirica]MBH1939480.1 redox-sensing transcriptional repressor Rex [Mobilitalea sibirica]